MKASEVNLSRFLAETDTQFIIPVYQRNYDWMKSQCKQLLDDIIDIGKTRRAAHFIGSIVYIHDDVYSTSSIRELTIIDGQQRITTITLLYIAMYKMAQELEDQRLVEKIHETYLINKFSKETDEVEKLKLKPTENNAKAIKFLLRGNSFETFSEYSLIIENYEYIKNRITAENFEVIQKGLEKLMFVEISLERGKDDPQRIFESLNSTGLDLTQADLIRNYILMGLDPKSQLKIYQDFWEPIEEQTKEEKTNEIRVSDFIRDFLTIQNREIPKKSNVYEEFKQKYPIYEFDTIKETLPIMRKLSYLYNRIINPDHESDRDIREQLTFINRLDINVLYPFLLELYNDYAETTLDKKTFVEILETIQSYVWRRSIVGLPSTSLSRIFMRLYEDVDKENYLTSIQKSLLRKKGNQRFPKDEEVLKALKEKDVYGIKSKNRVYFLERLENHNNVERVMIEQNPDITIEHIFPQNPDPKWKLSLEDESYRKMKDIYLNTIANLTLSGNNGALGNRIFQEKRDMNHNGKEQGYKYSRLWLNKYLATIDKWGISELEERLSIISDRFLQVWKYPQISLELLYHYDEVNIFEAEDPTHKKLSYAIFFDQKLPYRQVNKLYVHVMKTLFEMKPERFFATELGEKVCITKQRETLRTSEPLNEMYHIDTHLSNIQKFDRIKYALSIFEAEDDLYIRYEDQPNNKN